MVNLNTRMVSIETVWRHCGKRYFYRDFMVKLIWRLSGFFWATYGEP